MRIRRSIIVLCLAVVILLSLALVVVFSKYCQSVRLGSIMHQRIDRELHEIQTPPRTFQVQHIDGFRGTHGNVVKYYTSNLTREDIRAYYDQQLAIRGWRFKEESKLESWGKDVGESLRIYCKDVIAANVYFTGKNETVKGYTYSFSVSWRVVDECD
jgi:hypothetical protein